LLFAILASTLSVVSFPLLLDREANVETTVKTSVTAAIKNCGIFSGSLRAHFAAALGWFTVLMTQSQVLQKCVMKLRGNIRGAFVLDPDGNRPRARKVGLGVKRAGEIDEASRCHVKE